MNIEKLRDLRENMELTMQELANNLNIAKSSYSLWEEGIERIPLERLISICDYFNVSVDYLLDNTTDLNYSKVFNGFNKPKIVNRIKELRKELKITQNKLAQILNIGRTTIINYEKGSTIPNLDFINYFSKNYKISADYLLGRIDNPKYLKTK